MRRPCTVSNKKGGVNWTYVAALVSVNVMLTNPNSMTLSSKPWLPLSFESLLELSDVSSLPLTSNLDSKPTCLCHFWPTSVVYISKCLYWNNGNSQGEKVPLRPHLNVCIGNSNLHSIQEKAYRIMWHIKGHELQRHRSFWLKMMLNCRHTHLAAQSWGLFGVKHY